MSASHLGSLLHAIMIAWWCNHTHHRVISNLMWMLNEQWLVVGLWSSWWCYAFRIQTLLHVSHVKQIYIMWNKMPEELIYNHLAKWRDEFTEVIPYYWQVMSLGLSDEKNLAYFKKEWSVLRFFMLMLCFYVDESWYVYIHHTSTK